MPMSGTPFGYAQTPGNLSNILNNSGSFIIPNMGASGQGRDTTDHDDTD